MPTYPQVVPTPALDYLELMRRAWGMSASPMLPTGAPRVPQRPPAARAEMRAVNPAEPFYPMPTADVNALPPWAQFWSRAGAGVQSGVGSLAEQLGAEQWGREQQVEALPYLQPTDLTGPLHGLMDAAPSLASMYMGLTNPLLSGAAMFGQSTAGPDKWSLDPGTRALSGGVQGGIEYAGAVPEYMLLQSALPPWLKAPAMAASSIATNLGEEGAQGEAAAMIEQGAPFDPTRMAATMQEAIPATLAMGGMGAVLGSGGQPTDTPSPRSPKGEMGPGVRATSKTLTDLVTGVHNGLVGAKADSIGSTVHPEFGSLAGQPGYAVALHPDRVKKLKGPEVSKKDVTNFYLKNQDLYRKDPGLTVGTWYNRDDNTTYMDVSAVVPDLETALTIGRQNGEIAVWDMGNMQEVRIDYGPAPEQMTLFDEAAAGELVLRQIGPPDVSNLVPPVSFPRDPGPEPAEAPLIPSAPASPQLELPLEGGRVDRQTAPIRTPEGSLVLAAQEAPTGLRVPRGRRDWIGQGLETPQQMAALGRYLEDETVEHLTYAFVKDGKVVGTETLSANKPDQAPGLHPTDVGVKLDRLKADGVYVLHNHPSNVPDFSGPRGDRGVARGLQEILGPKLKGFSIVVGDSGAATHLDLNESALSAAQRHAPFERLRPSERLRLKKFVDSEVLGNIIDGADRVRETANRIRQRFGPVAYKDGALMMFIDAYGRVVGMETANGEQLSDPYAYVDYLNQRKAEYGAGRVIGWAGGDEGYQRLGDVAYHEDKPLLDVFTAEGRSDLENGRRYIPSQVGPEQTTLELAQEVSPYEPPRIAAESPTTNELAGTDITNPVDRANLSPGQQELLRRYIAGNEQRVLDARGGVQSAEDVDAQAAEYLTELEGAAAQIGLTVPEMMKKRGGVAMSASELMAGKAVLSMSVRNAQDAAKAASQPGATEQDLAAFASAFKDLQSSTDNFFKARAEWGRAGQVLNRQAMDFASTLKLISQAGGATTLKDLAFQMATIPEGQEAAFARKAGEKTWGDRAWGLWYSFMLSNPKTHIVNATSNAAYNQWLGLDRLTAATLGKLHTGDKVYFREMVPTMHGLTQGTLDAINAAKTYLKEGGEQSKFDAPGQGVEKLGPTNLIPRMMGSTDAFFRSVAFHQELRRLSLRQAISEGLSGEVLTEREQYIATHPDEFEDIIRQADAYAKKATFQEDLTKWFQTLDKLRDTKMGAPIASGLARLTVPFLRTIVNLTKQGARHTPGLSMLVPGWRDEVLAGGAKRDIAVAENLTGAGMMALAWALAEMGGATGAEPPDPAERAAWAMENQPVSVDVGGTWVGLNRIDPLASVFGLGASIPRILESEDPTWEVAEVMKQMLLSKTWMTGLADAFGATESYSPSEGKSKAQSWASGILSTGVPAVLGEVARDIDPYQRKQKDEGFLGRVQGRIPGWREQLAPRANLRGELAPANEFVGPDFISPFPAKPRPAMPDPVLAEMRRVGYIPRDLKKVGATKLDPRTATLYQLTARQIAWPELQELIGTTDYLMAGPADQADMIQKVLTRANKQAREELGLKGEE